MSGMNFGVGRPRRRSRYQVEANFSETYAAVEMTYRAAFFIPSNQRLKFFSENLARNFMHDIELALTTSGRKLVKSHLESFERGECEIVSVPFLAFVFCSSFRFFLG